MLGEAREIMAEIDILLQNYNQILSLSLTFLGIILAIFFTLIALPLQNILGKYSQDLVNRVNRDKWLIFCFVFFVMLFAYDFSLLVVPKSPILIFVSFLGGLLSLAVFSLLVLRVYYLLDVRNQVKDISRRIIREIRGKKTRIRIFRADANLTDRLKDETEIIFDIVQKAVHEDRFEIVAFGLKEAVKIANTYISVKGINLGREYEDPFLDHIFDRLIDTESFVSKRNHPRIMNSIVDSIGSVTKEILSTENIDPYTTNQWGPLSSLTFALIESLKNICIGPEIEKRTSYASGNARDQLIDIGIVALDNRYPYRTVDVVNELGEISKKTMGMNFYRGNRLSQSVNQGIVYLLGHSLENLDIIEIDKEYILNSMIVEISDIIKEFLKNEALHAGSNPENIKPLVSPQASHSVAVIYTTAQRKLDDDEKDAEIIGEFMNDFLKLLDEDVELAMEEGRYFDAKDIADSLYMTGFNFISGVDAYGIDQSGISQSDINQSENNESDIAKRNLLKEKLNESLLILYKPIKMSLDLDNHVIPFNDYLNNYWSLLGVMFFKNRENNAFEEMIKHGIKYVEEDLDKMADQSRMYPYLRLIGLWVFKWMPDSEFIITIRELLKNRVKTGEKSEKTSSEQPVEEEKTKEKERYEVLYPQLSRGEWVLKPLSSNKKALLEPFDDIQMKFDEMNRILFDLEDMERFERFLRD